MVNDTFTWFALDNIDFLEDTPSGKNTLHGTAMAMFQNMTERTSDEEMVLIRPADKNDKLRKIDATVKPFNHKIENPKYKIPIELNSLNDEGKNLKDFTWVLGSLNLSQSEKKVDGSGTWGAFNSLISSKLPLKTNVAVIPPILRLPPSNDDVLYTALLKIHDVSKKVNNSTTKTVVTLDLQLYDIAMKFYCSSLEIRNLFLFRPGELHIVIWALACIGDYIEGSGLDQAWVEAGLYSATTVNNQILKGKHIYRSLECHFITILSIYTLYFDHILKDLPDEHGIVTDLSNAIRDAFKKDATDQSDSREALSKILEDSYFYDKIVGISEKLKIHQESMKPIQRFLLNYVHQFENLLLFIRATRDRDIDLHLRATENLIKYFFAHDHLNYARLLPLYLATMQDVKKNEPSLWQEFKLGNFCVSKTNIRFTSIGPDHGIEHENRRMKVAGGIVGITQNENALDRFFITAPHLSSLDCEFERKYGLDNRKNIDRHHDLINTKAKRIKENVDKLCNVIKEHGDPFDSTENGLFNLLTQAFVTKKMENDILKRDDLGLTAFQNFVVRLDGQESIWSRLSKMKLSTFKNCNKTIKLTTEQGKVVALKEERNLLQRFIIIARSRPELSLEECIGEYEFGVVPRSLFSADGSLLPSRDKHKVSNLITKAIGDSTEDAHMINTVIILDGMAVVNALPTELIKMAKTYSIIVMRMSYLKHGLYMTIGTKDLYNRLLFYCKPIRDTRYRLEQTFKKLKWRLKQRHDKTCVIWQS